MLHDELILLKSWAASGSIINQEAAGGDLCLVEVECERIRSAWTNASFSSATNECLKRYYQHQLLELTEMCSQFDPNAAWCLTACALNLIDHLRLYHNSYFDAAITAPAIYRSRCAAMNYEARNGLVRRLKKASIAPELKACLLAFLKEIDAACSYRFLDYFQNWVTRLSAIDLTECHLNQTLDLLNFNDLAYYNYRQGILADCAVPIAEKINYLHNEKSKLMVLSPIQGLSCNPCWPSLNSMLCSWISEEMAFLSDKVRSRATDIAVTQPEKFLLNLSVAHLACFLKLFSGADLTGNRNLTQLFTFVTAHFSSKRQGNISAGSLSKEYYGTTQVTAAKVQGMLQQMIAEINRLYFP